MNNKAQNENRSLIAVIGDLETVTGFLLAGIGQRNQKGCNYLIVGEDTKPQDIEATFDKFINDPQISIILINQKIAENNLRPLINTYDRLFPTILEIPSKDVPYDLKKDSIALRAAKLLYGADANFDVN